ncbi:hypothetical protein U0070_007449 [Myodes glareolus]|uniref:Uncharacterized protein n=1 Tax=Myodes glareolus TaxID=447135 RepID=A0AAW0HYZ5_MYOGA
MDSLNKWQLLHQTVTSPAAPLQCLTDHCGFRLGALKLTVKRAGGPYFSVQEVLAGVREDLALGDKWQKQILENSLNRHQPPQPSVYCPAFGFTHLSLSNICHPESPLKNLWSHGLHLESWSTEHLNYRKENLSWSKSPTGTALRSCSRVRDCERTRKLESRNITNLFTQYEHRELRGNSNIVLYYKPSEKLARKTSKLVPLMSDEIFNS